MVTWAFRHNNLNLLSISDTQMLRKFSTSAPLLLSVVGANEVIDTLMNDMDGRSWAEFGAGFAVGAVIETAAEGLIVSACNS